MCPCSPVMHRSQGKYRDANDLYVSAVEIAERSLRSDYPQLAAITSDRADLLEREVSISIKALVHSIRCIRSVASDGLTFVDPALYSGKKRRRRCPVYFRCGDYEEITGARLLEGGCHHERPCRSTEKRGEDVLHGIGAVSSVQMQIGKRHAHGRPSCIIPRANTEKQMPCTCPL